MPSYCVTFRRTFINDDRLEFDADSLDEAIAMASDEVWGADVQLVDLAVDLDGVIIYEVEEIASA